MTKTWILAMCLAAAACGGGAATHDTNTPANLPDCDPPTSGSAGAPSSGNAGPGQTAGAPTGTSPTSAELDAKQAEMANNPRPAMGPPAKPCKAVGPAPTTTPAPPTTPAPAPAP